MSPTANAASLALLAALGSAACGADAGGGASDAGDATVDGGLVGPAIPWLATGEPDIARPAITCPPGWREVHPIDAEPDVIACDPWPVGGRATCSAVDEAHFPGEPGCARIGPACPAGDWATGLPTDRPIRYVKAGSPPGGDGTLARPFARISEARTGAAAGTVLALARGRYDEVVTLGAGMTLWGACVADTVVTSSTPSVGGLVVSAVGAGATIRDLRIDTPERIGAGAVNAGTSLEIRSIVIVAPLGTGVAAGFGASVDARDLVVRGGPTRETHGLEAIEGATLHASRVFIEASAGDGVLSASGATLMLEDAAVVSTRASASSPGNGLHIQSDGHVLASRVVIEQNASWDVVAMRSPEVALADVVLRGSVAGIVSTGAVVTAQRLWVDSQADVGLLLFDSSVVTLADCVVTGSASRGLAGIAATDGASLDAMRLALAHFQINALQFRDEGTTATIGDLVVRGALKSGLNVARGATATVTRALIADTESVAVGVDSAARLNLIDTLIRDVRADPSTGAYGRGIQVQFGGHVDAERVALVRAREAALVVTSASLEGRDVSIERVARAACADTTCAERSGGTGLAAYSSAEVSLTRFRIAEVALCGVQVADGAALDLSSGEVTRAEIGACVQVEGYDLGRLSDGVWYHDNGTNLRATTLPVPGIIDLEMVAP